MTEVRIICDPEQKGAVLEALRFGMSTGRVREYSSEPVFYTGPAGSMRVGV